MQIFNTNYPTQQTIYALAICVFIVNTTRADSDWPGFLGPGGNPVSSSSLPTEFRVSSEDQTAEHIGWRTELPGRSVSGPIVVDGKVITTSSGGIEGRWMYTTAVDQKTGDVIWQRSARSTGRPYCHPSSANAAPTPCTDGKHVYSFFSSNDLICYDLSGNLKWFLSLTDIHPLAGNDVGMSASPAVGGGVVVVTVECQADSFAAGIDAETGEVLWDITRPSKANWCSPRIRIDESGKGIALLQGSRELQAVELTSGQSIWSKELGGSSVVTSLVAGDTIYLPGRGVSALKSPSAFAEPTESWNSNRLSPGSASLVATKFGLIGLKRPSILVCCDESGEQKWNVRLKDVGQVWATPVVADDQLYLFSMSGKCLTVKLTDEAAEVVATSELGEEVLGSPAVVDGAMYVRSVDALWKISE
ncbi:MAG: PQQ-binding-like beta-propeller repeat protein [Aureliella sp.]